jgi:hypothetical protein
VENQGKLMPESGTGWSAGEQGVSPDLLAVRSALRGLPTLKCSPGFEYRLQRKLSGEENGVRVAGSLRGWSLGWAGAGLGFATALAIAFFAFDVGTPTHTNSQIAGASSAGPTVPVAPTQVVSSPGDNPQATNPLSVTGDKQLASASKDSTKPPANKADLNQDNFHVVDGK